MSQLFWNKCQGEVWCKLNAVNLEHPHFNNMNGVYIIWHGGPSAKTVYVGRGFIRERLNAHRNDPRIQNYSSLGLYVTWASVYAHNQEAVELFLANQLKPIVGERHPSVNPLAVNLPW